VGDYAGVEKMMRRNLSYYSAMVARRSSMDRDDARQVLSIRLWKAGGRYEQRGNASGERFYLQCIRTEADRLLRDERNAKQRFRRDAVSLDAPVNVDGEEADLLSVIPDPLDSIERVDNLDFLDSLLRRLNGRARDVLRVMMENGGSLSDAARRFGTSKQNICNVIRRRVRPMAKRMLAEV